MTIGKKLLAFVFAAFAMVTSYTGVAKAEGRGANVTITELAVNGTVAWIHLSADMTNTRPACNRAGARDLVFDPTTTWGKLFLSMAQSAKLSGRLVDVSGTNTCPANIGTTPTEGLGYIKIKD
jgi:hypothetical protein